jgi:hypothetical protein
MQNSIGGPDRWSIDQDFMTMQMVGVMQEVPNRDKRRPRIEVAEAVVDRAEAEGFQDARRTQGAVLVRPDGPAAEVRLTRQVALHGHTTGILVCPWRACR